MPLILGRPSDEYVRTASFDSRPVDCLRAWRAGGIGGRPLGVPNPQRRDEVSSRRVRRGQVDYRAVGDEVAALSGGASSVGLHQISGPRIADDVGTANS